MAPDETPPAEEPQSTSAEDPDKSLLIMGAIVGGVVFVVLLAVFFGAI